MMTLSSAHILSLTITLLAVTMVGISAARKVNTANDFTVGGNSSGSLLVAGTIIGTIVGGAATIGTAQLAYTVGLSAWWFTLGGGLALLLLARFYARPLRASKLQTIPQFLVLHFGPAAGPLVTIASSLGIFFSVVANILAAVPLTVAVFQLTTVQAVAVLFILIIAYVFFGGVWGTGLVGIIKTLLLLLVLGNVAVTAYQGMGGWSGYQATFAPFPWFSLFGRGMWLDIASGLSLIIGTLTTQTYIQAVYAARDVKTARNGALLAAIITLPMGIPAIMAGLYMRAHFPELAPIDALPQFILTQLPDWLGGIALAALLLASIGSAAGLALGMSSMLSRDILAKWSPRGSTLLINRALVLVIALTASCLAAGNLKSLVLDWNFLSMSLRGAGVFLPFTAAIFWPQRIAPSVAISSMALGTAASLGAKLLFPQGLDPLYAGILTSGIVLIAGQIWQTYCRNRRRTDGCG